MYIKNASSCDNVNDITIIPFFALFVNFFLFMLHSLEIIVINAQKKLSEKDTIPTALS